MDREYEGMTWNERLAAAGLLDAWDRAARRMDRAEMVRVLKCVETVEIVRANLHNFGF